MIVRLKASNTTRGAPCSPNDEASPAKASFLSSDESETTFLSIQYVKTSIWFILAPFMVFQSNRATEPTILVRKRLFLCARLFQC